MQPQSRIKNATWKTANVVVQGLPIVLGVLALSSLVNAAMPLENIGKILPSSAIFGPLFAAILGSLAAGHPLASYVVAGELRATGIDAATIIAFLVSWVTVGIVQLPAEIASLGRRFAIYRAVFCFLSSVAIAYLLTLTLRVTGA
jgi:uncharacterized membrane protein YraQ (UPF0718 family)